MNRNAGRRSVAAEVYSNTRGKDKFGDWKAKFRSRAISHVKGLRSNLLAQARLSGVGDREQIEMQVDNEVKRTNYTQILNEQWEEFYEEEHPDVHSQDEWMLFMVEMQETVQQALLEREFEAYDSYEREQLEYQISLMPPDTTNFETEDTDTVMT